MKTFILPAALLLTVCASALADDGGGKPNAVFMGLGDLPGGEFLSIAYAVSADGSTVVGESVSQAGREAFRWTKADGMVALGSLPGGIVRSVAFGVNANGSVIVGADVSNEDSYENTTQAFRWTQSGGMVGLGDLPGGTADSWANAVSAGGSVVIGSSYSVNGQEAYRWTQEDGMIGLGDLPGGGSQTPTGFLSQAYGVSDDGSVIVGTSESALGHEVFRWTQAEGLVGLGFIPGASVSLGFAISADGSTIVGSCSTYGENYSINGQSESFRWTRNEGMVGLGDLPGGPFYSAADCVNGDGSIVLGTSWAEDTHKVFMWSERDGMRSLSDVLMNDYALDLTGWKLRQALGVSADGRTIVGSGYGPNGPEAFIAILPPPCPADIDDSGSLSITDIFDFLTAWLAGNSAADFNHANGVTVQDIFDFLTAWLAGC